MAIFVVDASAALAWCFEDEANRSSDGLLKGGRCAPHSIPIAIVEKISDAPLLRSSV